MTLLFLSLGIGFLLSKLITDSIHKQYNEYTDDVFIYNKKQFISIFKALKKRSFSSKLSKQSIASILKTLVHANESSMQKSIKTKYVFYFIPGLILILYFSYGSPFYQFKDNSKNTLSSSLNINELTNIDFSHIETMTKEDQITLYLKLAIIANNTDNLKAEIFALEKLSSLDLENLDLKVTLAQKLTKQAFGIVTPNARDLVKNVLIKDPENLDALYLAGLAAKQNGRSDLATKIWEQIIKYNPQYKNIDLIKDELQQINKLN